MNKNTFKSIGAVLAGFMTGAILSIVTDVVLNNAGIMKMDPFTENSAGVILLVIVYRFIYNVVGCYVAAALAPNRPMRHAMIIGIIGLVLSIVGSIAMWDIAVAWYNISIILISVPCAWIGGKLYLSRNKSNQ